MMNGRSNSIEIILSNYFARYNFDAMEFFEAKEDRLVIILAVPACIQLINFAERCLLLID